MTRKYVSPTVESKEILFQQTLAATYALEHQPRYNPVRIAMDVETSIDFALQGLRNHGGDHLKSTFKVPSIDRTIATAIKGAEGLKK